MWDEILNMTFLASFLSAAVRMGVPLAYAALGETVSQKAGTLNIGLEANMLAGAFFGFAAAVVAALDKQREGGKKKCNSPDKFFRNGA